MIVNGPFYNSLKAARNYSIPLTQCIESTVQRLLESDTNEDRPGMLLGRIQSGKTSAFIGILALAFDNSYDIAVVLTKGTRALASQTYKRLVDDFKPFVEDDTLQIYDIMSLPPKLTNYVLKQKIILVAKKTEG